MRVSHCSRKCSSSPPPQYSSETLNERKSIIQFNSHWNFLSWIYNVTVVSKFVTNTWNSLAYVTDSCACIWEPRSLTLDARVVAADALKQNGQHLWPVCGTFVKLSLSHISDMFSHLMTDITTEGMTRKFEEKISALQLSKAPMAISGLSSSWLYSQIFGGYLAQAM